MTDQLWAYLGAAFLGGVILNIMPCVLPVLTMKVFHIVDQGAEDAASNRRHGVAYSLGILATFACFAGGVIAIKASGQLIGWGMQFQNPGFVAGVTALMVVLGLNALGVFEFAVSVSGGGGKGYWGSFGNGVVASIMATPCSAPFLGTAAAVAFGTESSAGQTLAIFLFIGLGLAFPFALISFIPALSRLLPKPGTWMETFKILMGFTLLGAAVWLLGVLMGQVTVDGAVWFLGFLVLMSLGLWAMDRFGGFQHSTTRRRMVRLGVVVALVLAGQQMIDLEKPVARAQTASFSDQPATVDGKINWAGFNPTRVAMEKKRNRPVFMDYTADWCLNCKTNEKLFIETAAVREALENSGILAMKADWTNEDEGVTQWLTELGRSGIPAYVVYYPDGTRNLLPEVITEEMILGALSVATQKFPREKFRSIEEACFSP